ncbi:hypothetical protein J6352_19755, partial [Burkholderia pseudomallei]|uniref:hypothetical protein n=1 Tax=Burkholderia pseudomallei TaxID=28450 RepID=UPI001AD733C8
TAAAHRQRRKPQGSALAKPSELQSAPSHCKATSGTHAQIIRIAQQLQIALFDTPFTIISISPKFQHRANISARKITQKTTNNHNTSNK